MSYHQELQTITNQLNYNNKLFSKSYTFFPISSISSISLVMYILKARKKSFVASSNGSAIDMSVSNTFLNFSMTIVTIAFLLWLKLS